MCLLSPVSGLCTDVVIVKPEPVNNEGKDEFKGPEFRTKGGSKVKEESQRRRPGEALFQTCVCGFYFLFFLPYLFLSFAQMSTLKRSGVRELIALLAGNKSIISRGTLCISILYSKFFSAK